MLPLGITTIPRHGIGPPQFFTGSIIGHNAGNLQETSISSVPVVSNIVSPSVVTSSSSATMAHHQQQQLSNPLLVASQTLPPTLSSIQGPAAPSVAVSSSSLSSTVAPNMTILSTGISIQDYAQQQQVSPQSIQMNVPSSMSITPQLSQQQHQQQQQHQSKINDRQQIQYFYG